MVLYQMSPSVLQLSMINVYTSPIRYPWGGKEAALSLQKVLQAVMQIEIIHVVDYNEDVSL